MATQEVSDRNNLFTAMSEDKPLRSYIKTILGKVYVEVWNSLTNKTEGLLMEGDPRKKDAGSIFDTFSEQEDVFFRRRNKRHFDTGILISYSRPVDVVREKTIEEFSDEELTTIINKPFLALQAVLNKTESEIVISRILVLAQELDKSDKVVRAIESRLSEVQGGTTMPSVLEEEL